MTKQNSSNRKSYLISILIISIVFISTLFTACDEEVTPRPRGYFRIDLPSKHYERFSSNCPFSFEYPNYSLIHHHDSIHACWYNIDFPLFHARIHLTYKPVGNSLHELLEESRSLAFKHSSKADAINEKLISFPDKRVFGTKYDIKGNAASSVQFYLTDSTDNFLRAALYFSVSPNIDSIAPVVKFIEKDIDRFINSFEWEK